MTTPAPDPKPGNPEPPVPAPSADQTAEALRNTRQLWLMILGVVALNSLVFLKTCSDAPANAIDKAGQALERVAAAFNRGTITTQFISHATTMTNTLRLEVAQLHQVEILTRKQETSTAFGFIPLPDVVVEARAPVEYTYYLDLQAAWKFDVRDKIVRVTAPGLRFNKPSVDASGIEYEVRKGMFKTDEALTALKRSITSMVEARASENIALVRENARRQAGKFVEQWLSRTFVDGKDCVVVVRFDDEPSDRPVE
jgi:hypothetical protein